MILRLCVQFIDFSEISSFLDYCSGLTHRNFLDWRHPNSVDSEKRCAQIQMTSDCHRSSSEVTVFRYHHDRYPDLKSVEMSALMAYMYDPVHSDPGLTIAMVDSSVADMQDYPHYFFACEAYTPDVFVSGHSPECLPIAQVP